MPPWLDKSANEAFTPSLQAHIRSAQQGDVVRNVDQAQGMIELYWPFTIGGTETPWVLMLRLPEQAVFAGLNNMQEQMHEQRTASMLSMLGMGLVIAFLGLLASWVLGSSISRPLRTPRRAYA